MRLHQSIPFFFLNLGFQILQILASEAPLILANTYNVVTQIARDDKNAGSFADLGDDDSTTDESIRWGSTAQQRGSQLQIVTQALKDLGDVGAAQSMLSLNGMDANQSMLVVLQAGEYLEYFKGPLLSQVKDDPLYVTLIFYGKQWKSSEIAILENFIKSFSPAKRGGPNDRTVDRWWDITTDYYHDYKNRSIAKEIVLRPSVKDVRSQAPFGTRKKPLKDNKLRSIITKAHDGKKPSRNSLFFVLTSPEVHVQGFGTEMCTYHSSFRLQKMNVPYAFVGNPALQALKTCSYQYYDPMVATKNGVAIDAVVNWMAHSFTKAATNPFPEKNGKVGWTVAGTGIENGDLCAWDFGYVGFEITSGSKPQYLTYNIKGGDTSYLIQRNYNPIKKECVIIGRNVKDTPIPFPT